MSKPTSETTLSALEDIEALKARTEKLEARLEQTFQAGVRKGCEISEVWTDREQVIETERRKAFEAGWMARLVRSRNFDEAYSAYTEAALSKETNNL